MGCWAMKVTRGRVGRLVGALILALVAGSVGSASPASAQAADLTCPGWATTTYQPGMTNQPKTIHINGSGVYGPCVSSDPTLTAGTFQASGSGVVSCTGGTFTGTISFEWNNGNHSVVSYTAVIGQRVLGEVVVVVEGTVTGGQFQGDQFLHTVTLFNLVPLDCATPQGVTSTAGPETITFVQP